MREGYLGHGERIDALPEPVFGVWCEVWGGITGSREAWLKERGEIARFETLEEAEAKAAECRAGISPYSRASFAYSARVMS